MFTGIITDIGTVEAIEQKGDLRVRIGTRYDTQSIDMGASISCSGACLTVVDKGPGWFAVDVSQETVARTASAVWAEGQRINLERALRVGDELGGHIVTGHVDGVGRIVSAHPVGGSIALTVWVPDDLAGYLAAKGSVALDGISLTVNTVEDGPEGTVIGLNIIPHTAEMTTFATLEPGRPLNIEIDVLARYLGRMEELNHARKR
ncbi:riboflavin synthase [Sphingomonas sp. AP4-R1]|uniref:riboflavin synthase n=1 Tax=Sphingomonas sp. AP4-R1 TaxID=2735134 RepID=UPI001493CCB7|nr:riboflavin synthase [Sphingomonas sp. AP4-R1]QJU56729.1 riboflavin synthase [Sphingomonas sp. AP4-R1]